MFTYITSSVSVIFIFTIAVWVHDENFVRAQESAEESVTDSKMENIGPEFFNRFDFQDINFFSTVPDLNNNNEKQFSNSNQVCEENMKKYSNLVDTVDTYVQRYISLFLITSNLLNYVIKDTDDMINIDLEISISKEDLAYLQGYSKSTDSEAYPKNLSKLESIFSKIAKLREKSLLESSLKSFWSLVPSINIYSLFTFEGIPYLFIYFILLCTPFILHFGFGQTWSRVSLIIINCMILLDSLQLYFKKIKELDMEIYLQTLKLQKAPEECYSDRQSWYDSTLTYFRNTFFGDPCTEYFRNLKKNPVEEVALFQCIVETYGKYFIQIPSRILGLSIKDMTSEISGVLPSPFNYLLRIPLILFVFIFFIFVMIVVFGKRLRLSFFGAGFEVGDVKNITVNKMDALTNIAPQATRALKKLKPWTLNKSSTKSELHLTKRRKLSLKPSKSVPCIPNLSQEVFDSFSSSVASGSTKTPHSGDN